MHTSQRRRSGVRKPKCRATWDLCSSPKLFSPQVSPSYSPESTKEKASARAFDTVSRATAGRHRNPKALLHADPTVFVAYIGHLRRCVGFARRYHSIPCLQKKRHPHDLLTRRALCPDRHVRRCGHHIQRRRQQPLSQRSRETRCGFHATPDRSEIGAAGTRPVRSGPFRRYR